MTANFHQLTFSVDLALIFCVFSAPGPQGNDGNGGFSVMFLLMAWLVAAVVLFLLRPQTMRQGGSEKPSNQVYLSLSV